MSHRLSRLAALPGALAHVTMTFTACILLAGCASAVGTSYVKPVAEPVSEPADSKAKAQDASAAQCPQGKVTKDCPKKSDAK